MIIFRPFKGIRPGKEYAHKVAALPYDVIETEKAVEHVKDNPYSFLHVEKAEIDIVNLNEYNESVYNKAKENLNKLLEDNVLQEDGDRQIYIYRQIMNGRSQTGIVGCTSVEDYRNGLIKKHELTREDKEKDRIAHVDACSAHTGPIFLTYKYKKEIEDIINDWVGREPVYDFQSEDGIIHMVWVVDEEPVISKMCALVSDLDYLYIADGHHRAAAADKVAEIRKARQQNSDGDEYNYFLSVLFPDKDLYIMSYNRVVQELNGLSTEDFLLKASEKFEISRYDGEGPYRPSCKHTYGMYLDRKWYRLTAKEGTYNPGDPVDRLDVSILHDNLLKPILGILDPRTDKRIDFIGGIKGLDELMKKVEDGAKVAFSLYPVSIHEIMDIADVGKVMPPKSTWFEPKLRSGLFVHRL